MRTGSADAKEQWNKKNKKSASLIGFILPIYLAGYRVVNFYSHIAHTWCGNVNHVKLLII